MTDTGQVPVEGLPENAGMVEQPGIPTPGAYTYLAPSAPVTEDEDLLLMPSAQGGWNDPQVVPGEAPVAYAAPEGYATPDGYAAAPETYAPVAPEAYAVPEQVLIQQQMPSIEQPAPIQEPVAQVHAEAPDGYQPQPEFTAEPAQQAPVAQAEFEQSAAPVEPEPPVVSEVVTDLPQPGQTPHQPGAHEAGGRDTGSVDLTGVRMPAPAPAPAAAPAPAPVQTPARRPLHMGPPVPDPTGGVVRSLADRGPAGTPTQAVRVRAQAQGPATTGPEYLDVPREEPAVLAGPQLSEIPPQAGAPWSAEPPPAEPEAVAVVVAPEAPADTVVPEPETQAEPVPVPVPAEPEPVEPEPEVAAVVEPEPQPEPIAPEPPAVEQPPEPASELEPEPELEAEPGPEPVAEAPAAEAVEPAEAQEAPAPAAEQIEQPAEEPVLVLAPEPEAAPEPEPVQESAPEAAPEPEPAPVQESAPEPAPEPAHEPEAAPEPEPLAESTAAPEPVAVQVPEPEPIAVPEPEPQPEAEPAPVAQEGTQEGTAAPSGYDDAERDAVLRVMRERRDIRNGFRSDPIPHEVLLRVLEAAHTAPSVGHSQPWDFVVIRSAETRRSMHELAQRQRDAYAKALPKGRAKQFKELKIEAILDTPVNIVVTADPTRGGRHTLGRHTQPQMAPYSSALAVENLWLAARAEGLGVGWVSFFDEREMVRALGLPEHLEVVAYLCVGYVDEFPVEPELMQADWSKRRPLSWVVHEETYGRRALPGEEPHDLLQETIAGIRPLDAKALGEAWERQKRMTKPAGALGMLEIISAQLSGLSRLCPPPIPEPAAVAIFAGDHGVHAQGVTPWPQEVTGQMVANFLGGGAVCNAFATQVGAEVCVIDVGVVGELQATPGLLPRKVRAGTADFTTGPALSREEVLAAIEVGIETARDLVAAGNKALLTGEMGIANTTVSAALICVYTGQDPAEVTGRGTGINDEMHARKVDVVRRGLDLHQPDPSDPVGVLAAIGGLEHAALVGFLLGGASLRTPVILDGVSAGAAALVARAIAPEALAACIAGHRSAEPGHVAALNKLGLRPLVDLDLRLGEGTGALLALPVVQSAARAMHEVATFDSAGVTEK
ncbi:nicotinate-nucleotide--dimethylbenzimidazole phosphoribosyltransferase [Streptomyces scopuliridis]|uniref:nicotinate-nucleotide--dimethylbenzimidazole phosphoribosyltransferase n=1 Tax=Streptomyces scopuliridis TaxID=452529 RepID=UPI0036939A1B